MVQRIILKCQKNFEKKVDKIPDFVLQFDSIVFDTKEFDGKCCTRSRGVEYG